MDLFENLDDVVNHDSYEIDGVGSSTWRVLDAIDQARLQGSDAVVVSRRDLKIMFKELVKLNRHVLRDLTDFEEEAKEAKRLENLLDYAYEEVEDLKNKVVGLQIRVNRATDALTE